MERRLQMLVFSFPAGPNLVWDILAALGVSALALRAM